MFSASADAQTPSCSSHAVVAPLAAAVSANLRRCSIVHATEAVTQVLQSVAHDQCEASVDVVLLQECPTWPSSPIQLGSSAWYIFGEAGNDTAIAVHGRLRGTVQRFGTGHRHTYVVTESHLFLSCYLPDASYGLEDYCKAIGDITRTLKAHRGRGRFRKRIVLGGDLNISVASRLGDLTGEAVPPEKAHKGVDAADLLEKRSLWTGLAVDFNLVF